MTPPSPPEHDPVPNNILEALAPTGELRAAINLGNPVLAQGTPQDPSGVTVELARALAADLGVGVRFGCHTAARDSFAALVDGTADVAFLAVEPARAEQVAFSAPYVVIDGVFVVPVDSRIRDVAEVDRDGIRIGVKRGSAYDLFLTRTLEHATLVRGDEGTDVLLTEQLEAGAGIRQPVARFVLDQREYRLIDDRFMQIRQAVAVARQQPATVRRWVHERVETYKRNGLVARALQASGQHDATVADAADDRG